MTDPEILSRGPLYYPVVRDTMSTKNFPFGAIVCPPQAGFGATGRTGPICDSWTTQLIKRLPRSPWSTPSEFQIGDLNLSRYCSLVGPVVVRECVHCREENLRPFVRIGLNCQTWVPANLCSHGQCKLPVENIDVQVLRFLFFLWNVR